VFLLIGGLIWLAVVLWLRELAARSELDLTLLHVLLLPKMVLKQLGIVRIVVIYLCFVATAFLVLMHRLTGT
jgi:hypothetical protein